MTATNGSLKVRNVLFNFGDIKKTFGFSTWLTFFLKDKTYI